MGHRTRHKPNKQDTIQASMQTGHKLDKQDMVLDAREIMRTWYGTFMGYMEHELNLLDTTNRAGRAPKAVTGRWLNELT